MNFVETSFEGLFVIENSLFKDNRGYFFKPYSDELFREFGLSPKFVEVYYSVNRKDVIRGMHFQLPPFAHDKLVYVSNGRIIDYVVDLRKKSSTYGRNFSIELSDHCGRCLFIPVGFAHGFVSLEDNTIVNYAQTTCYNPTADSGINSLSCGIDWGINNPIISNRDKTLIDLIDFNSPF